MDELEKLVARLMAAVRNMPPGQQRQDALKEIGRLRFRMDALLRSASSSQSLTTLADSKRLPHRSEKAFQTIDKRRKSLARR